jgi:hypothetical protein
MPSRRNLLWWTRLAEMHIDLKIQGLPVVTGMKVK